MKYQQEEARLALSWKLCRRAGKQRCRHTIPGYGDSADNEHACMGMFWKYLWGRWRRRIFS